MLETLVTKVTNLEQGQIKLEKDIKNLRVITNHIFEDIRKLDDRTKLLENKA